jgi:hypothetical protein
VLSPRFGELSASCAVDFDDYVSRTARLRKISAPLYSLLRSSMEAAMRMTSHSPIVLVVSFLMLTVHAPRVVAQIEFAHTTIRLKSPTPPAASKAATATQASYETSSHIQYSPSDSNQAQATPKPVTQHAVRQANFIVPDASGQSSAARAATRAPSLVGVNAGRSAVTTLSKMPRPAPVQPNPAPPQKHQLGKPFQSVQNEPTISPYLNMNRTEARENTLPNYFTFVRPQLEQQEANRQQTAELQKLRTQVQNLTSGGSGPPPSASMPAHARYMDTAQFYRGMRR